MKFAFFYRVYNPSTKVYYFVVIISKCHSYTDYESGWMCDPLLPSANYPFPAHPYTTIPDLDISESKHRFETEQEAYDFMVNFYARQLPVPEEVVQEELVDSTSRKYELTN